MLLVAALLYGAGYARASESYEPRPVTLAPAPAAGPHIALLLPTESAAFAPAAEAVHAGFLEASRRLPGALPVRLYAVNDDPQQVLTTYRAAVAAGARLVVGPLTRNGVTALAGAPDLITVPTLALNVPETGAASAAGLYVLSLQVESEARQAAQLALSEGRRKAFTVSAPTPLARRMREAFVEEFQRGGGYHIAEYGYTDDPAGLERMRSAAATGVADMVFYALDAARLRTVRPYMATLTGYGTSQLNPGSTGPAAGAVDIADVRFVDMPWMVQPDHPAVMIYQRPYAQTSDDLARLYALGIDARRLAQDFVAGTPAIALDGVTGRLHLDAGGRFRRGLLVTLIDGGRLTVLGESRP